MIQIEIKLLNKKFNMSYFIFKSKKKTKTKYEN